MTTQRFAVEYNRRTVGIAVRVPGGFIFYSSDRDFDAMDGNLFPRAAAIEKRLRKIGKKRARAGPAFGRSPVFA